MSGPGFKLHPSESSIHVCFSFRPHIRPSKVSAPHPTAFSALVPPSLRTRSLRTPQDSPCLFLSRNFPFLSVVNSILRLFRSIRQPLPYPLLPLFLTPPTRSLTFKLRTAFFLAPLCKRFFLDSSAWPDRVKDTNSLGHI